MKTRVVQTVPDDRAHPASPTDHVIATVGLSKRYGGAAALDGLDLVVPRNSIIGFLGANGAGKTTTIKLLLGLSRPTAGSAMVFGMDTVGDSLGIRARIGYLAQDPRFYGHLTARETLEFSARFFYSGPTGGIRARIAETLELVGLESKADRPIRGFSGGERQRLGIAQAQINHPDLLILDEPAAALDPLGRRDVLEIMERLRSTRRSSTRHISSTMCSGSATTSPSCTTAIWWRTHPPPSSSTAGPVGIQVVIRGDARNTLDTLRDLSWVTEVDASSKDGLTSVSVSVAEPEAAEALLLRSVLADDSVVVTSFDRKHFSLEDVFLQLVEGEPR